MENKDYLNREKLIEKELSKYSKIEIYDVSLLLLDSLKSRMHTKSYLDILVKNYGLLFLDAHFTILKNEMNELKESLPENNSLVTDDIYSKISKKLISLISFLVLEEIEFLISDYNKIIEENKKINNLKNEELILKYLVCYEVLSFTHFLEELKVKFEKSN